MVENSILIGFIGGLEQGLLDNKLAYEYSGGKKLSWCK